MSDIDQIKNIIAFLSIIFGESEVWEKEIMNKQPEYLMEKFERYILSKRDQHSWGLNPSLRNRIFNRYCKKHGLSTEQYNEP